MFLLGIDTCARQGSVALLQSTDLSAESVNGSGPDHASAAVTADATLVTLELEPLAGGRFSEQLLPTVADVLARRKLAKSSLGLIAVASGPGSFTGLRVAISTVKGLAEAFGTPVVAVSALEAIAQASAAQGRIFAVLDAQRSELFFGEYSGEYSLQAPLQNSDSHTAHMLREGVAPVAEFVAMLQQAPAKVFTPDAPLAERLCEAGINTELLAQPTAADFARIGYCKFLAGHRDDLATLDANYLRRSDAELFSAPKLGIPPA